MAEADLAAVRLAGGRSAPVAIIPAAAVPAKDHANAGGNGVRWFRSLGHPSVRSLDLVDRASAEDPRISSDLERSRLIFMLGGSPRYLAETLKGTRAWKAVLRAHRQGAVVGGSSAGAMVLCDRFFDRASQRVLPGLGLLPGCCVLPHHDTFGKKWAPALRRLLPGASLVGIDEETGLLNDGPAGEWTVYGDGAVTLYTAGSLTRYRHGQSMVLPIKAG
jgi:cyanophycinase